MRRADFGFELPEELIAQYPTARRGDSRLLQLSRRDGALHDLHFSDFPGLLAPGDLLVFNDTRVIPARLLGHKASGGKVELLLERLLDRQRALVMLRSSKSPAPDTLLHFEGGVRVRVLARRDNFFKVEFEGETPALELLEQHGHMPLPPYIRRADTHLDQGRYQTVYARQPGAVAAPTAGLHFDQAMLGRLKQDGVEFGYLTLHVGAGTFQPVREDDLSRHAMHAEYLHVSEELCAQIRAAKAKGGRVVGVGTTTLRALESAALSGELAPFEGETRLFITPGFQFRVLDALLTNFHLPESTLLMLVSAFADRESVLRAYRHAVAARYRFFSYGDAMFIA